MKRAICTAAVILVFWANALNASNQSLIDRGMPFAEARKLLVNHGWRPKKTPKLTERFAVERTLLRQGVVEVESCSVDSFCIFRYIKGRQCLKLVAHGESLRDLEVIHWDNSCS